MNVNRTPKFPAKIIEHIFTLIIQFCLYVKRLVIISIQEHKISPCRQSLIWDKLRRGFLSYAKVQTVEAMRKRKNDDFTAKEFSLKKHKKNSDIFRFELRHKFWTLKTTTFLRSNEFIKLSSLDSTNRCKILCCKTLTSNT